MLSDKIYTQVERIVDRLAEIDIEDNLWEYNGLADTLKDIFPVYLNQKENEFFYSGDRKDLITDEGYSN